MKFKYKQKFERRKVIPRFKKRFKELVAHEATIKGSNHLVMITWDMKIMLVRFKYLKKCILEYRRFKYVQSKKISLLLSHEEFSYHISLCL